MEYLHRYDSPIGTLYLYSDGHFLTGLHMEEILPGLVEDLPVFRQTAQWLDSYFQGEAARIPEIPTLPRGTGFQRIVWERLMSIPYGATVTYGQIARELEETLGRRMSAQAVGQAVGANPISIWIPCHRVVGSNGKLTGYEWGIEKKQWLLCHEMKKERGI